MSNFCDHLRLRANCPKCSVIEPLPAGSKVRMAVSPKKRAVVGDVLPYVEAGNVRGQMRVEARNEGAYTDTSDTLQPVDYLVGVIA